MNFLSRFRFTRFDVVLLVGLVLTSGILMAIERSAEPVTATRKKASSWSAEEAQVKKQFQSASALNRKLLEKRIRQDPLLERQMAVASWGSFLILVGSLWGVIRLAFKILSRRPIYSSVGIPGPPTWTLRDILRLFALLVIVAQAAVGMEWLFLSLLRPRWLDRHLLVLGNTLLMDGVAIIGASVLLTGRGHVRIFSRLGATLRFALASYLTFLPFLGLLTGLVAAVLSLLKVEPAPQPIFTLYLSEMRAPVLWWLLLLVTVAGPVAEELFFRGLLYGWLRTRLGVSRAIFLSAVLFAAFHSDPVVFVPIGALGMLFAWVYEETGSLAAPIAIHILHNGGMFYLASLAKSILSLAS